MVTDREQGSGNNKAEGSMSVAKFDKREQLFTALHS